MSSPIPTASLDDPALKKFFRASQEVYAIAHDLAAGMNRQSDTDWGRSAR